MIAPLPATSVPHGRLWTVEELSIYLGIPVFRTPGGSMLRLPNWRRDVFLLARDRACISPRFRIHDLRHTASSLVCDLAVRWRARRDSNPQPSDP